MTLPTDGEPVVVSIPYGTIKSLTRSYPIENISRCFNSLWYN